MDDNTNTHVKDAAGNLCTLDTLVWVAQEDGSFTKANIFDIDFINGIISVMTIANVLMEINFQPKTKPTCNSILKGFR